MRDRGCAARRRWLPPPRLFPAAGPISGAGVRSRGLGSLGRCGSARRRAARRKDQRALHHGKVCHPMADFPTPPVAGGRCRSAYRCAYDEPCFDGRGDAPSGLRRRVRPRTHKVQGLVYRNFFHHLQWWWNRDSRALQAWMRRGGMIHPSSATAAGARTAARQTVGVREALQGPWPFSMQHAEGSSAGAPVSSGAAAGAPEKGRARRTQRRAPAPRRDGAGTDLRAS